MPLKGACVMDGFWSLSYRIFAMRSFSYFSSSSADSSGLKTDLQRGAMSSVPALHQAALDDDESACQALLLDGVDRDSVDNAGCTAFNLSCYKGSVRVSCE